ncbi:acyltransferase [Pseudobacteroides cellulosolvens]|uniref:Acyltransferase 3 n=1 Tax=Pseudobacteroides cellulosolvens ATCC 35603 = DSM 2933 TaxID=398512 RepID=A0A0L6JG54_9FIRM|nr:acyltransferase [Pseudobacteroides cellulosolvens]KNY24841.1 acyltransferase 3 [Pseudobacteroides cellulosolvens ATCC 35603 = DSM 2933]
MDRDLFFENLRGIAILCVIAIHVISSGNINGYYGLTVRQLIAFAVPVFVFISGYWMGKKEIETTNQYFEFIKKRLSKILVPYIIWSIIAIAFKMLMGESFNLVDIIKIFVFAEGMGPFYFIIVIMQLYILLPLLKKMSLWLALTINLMSISVLYIMHYNGYEFQSIRYALPCTMWIFFFVLGIWFNKKNSFNNAFVCIFLIATFALSMIESLVLKYFAFSTIKLSSFLYSIAIIIAFFTLKDRFRSKTILTSIGEFSFGIYFTHMFVLIPILKVLGKVSFIRNIEPLYHVIAIMIVGAICYIAIFVSKKTIPGRINQSVGFNL